MPANSRLRASEYSVPVLGLIFLRFADQKFAVADAEIKRQFAAVAGRPSRRTLMKEDYQAAGVRQSARVWLSGNYWVSWRELG